MSASSPLTLDPRDYTVAWIAPLEIEARAALHMLDTRHRGKFPVSRGDDHVFHAGEMNGHNMVIATLPAGQEYGTGSAAALASQLKKFFPNLWFGLLVGVAAGLPDLSRESPRDIRLGDVLVGLAEGESAGLVAFDLGKETIDGFQPLRDGRALAMTEPIVRSAIGSIKIEAPNEGPLFLPFFEIIREKEHANGNFDDPGQDRDLLYCHQAGERIERAPRPPSKRTRVWYGPIGSGDKLLKNSLKRDEIKDKYDLIGLEMEAAGTINRIPVGVIRGACDYGDYHKNKEWQPYAAAMAAAYAKAVIYQIPPASHVSQSHKEGEYPADGEKAPEELRTTTTGCAGTGMSVIDANKAQGTGHEPKNIQAEFQAEFPMILQELRKAKIRSEVDASRAQKAEDELNKVKKQLQINADRAQEAEDELNTVKEQLQIDANKAQEAEDELNKVKTQLRIDTYNAQIAAQELNNSRAECRTLIKEIDRLSTYDLIHLTHQVTDADLITKVHMLRNNISSITNKFFERNPTAAQSSPPDVRKYSLNMSGVRFSNLMQSKAGSRVLVVESLIWAVLCTTLFGKFAWVSRKVAHAVENTKEFMHPRLKSTPVEERVPASRRWHIWKAHTSIALLETLKVEAEAGRSKEDALCAKLTETFEHLLRVFVKTTERNAFSIALREIICEAIALDQVINKQAVSFTWVYQPDQLLQEYSSKHMEFAVETQSRSKIPPKRDLLTVNPGLVRKGKPNGEGFNKIFFLIKTKVVDHSSLN